MRRKNHMIGNGDGEESFGSDEFMDELIMSLGSIQVSMPSFTSAHGFI